MFGRRFHRFLALTASRTPRWQWLALFLTVVGARFALIHQYAAPLPFWDQWDAEAANFFKPWLEGEWGWHDLFALHNEHRIVLTRLLALGLLTVNGQWDPALEMAASAVFCGVEAVLVGAALTRAFAGAYRRTILGAVALCFGLPFGWENTLSGFQSMNYFLIGFSLAAVWGLGTRRPGSAAWWAGLGAALLACLSMGSGFLAAAAVLALGGLRLVRERRGPSRGEIVTALLCLGIIAAGCLTRAEPDVHEELRVESSGAFVAALGRFLAWPLDEAPLVGLAAVAPLGLLALAYLRGPVPAKTDGADRPAELVLGVGAWTLLQAAALAFARGGHAVLPAVRYLDLLAVGTLASGCAWLVLLPGARRGAKLFGVSLGATAWLLLVAGGLMDGTRNDFSAGLRFRCETLHQGTHNVHGYVATQDFARFLDQPPRDDIPYPDPVRLAGLLDDPTLRAILPAGIRPALALRVDSPADGAAFVPDGVAPGSDHLAGGRVWGSFTDRGAAAQGEFRVSVAGPLHLPYVRLLFAGGGGGQGLRFSLRDPVSGRHRDYRPGGLGGGHWRTEYFRLPGRGGLQLTATDRDPAGWFAFTEPVEVGAWSYWAAYGLRQGGTILAAGLLLGFGLEIAWLASRTPVLRN